MFARYSCISATAINMIGVIFKRDFKIFVFIFANSSRVHWRFPYEGGRRIAARIIPRQCHVAGRHSLTHGQRIKGADCYNYFRRRPANFRSPLWRVVLKSQPGFRAVMGIFPQQSNVILDFPLPINKLLFSGKADSFLEENLARDAGPTRKTIFCATIGLDQRTIWNCYSAFASESA